MKANHDMWENTKFYLVECSAIYRHCGGTADRLGPIPFHIRMAAKFQRLLFISWRDNRPAPLETFLLPPIGGLDWRFPEWLLEKLMENSKPRRVATSVDQILQFGQNQRVIWLRVKFQSHDHGRAAFDKQRINAEDPSYVQVYHDTWRVIFTPTSPIAHRIEQNMQSMGLLPGRYVSAHLRALYGVPDRDEDNIRLWTRQIINCATSKVYRYAPGENKFGMPILFVSDSSVATEEAGNYGMKTSIQIAYRPHNGQQPLHLEKNNSTDVKNFFDTFVDILMIGLGRCTVYSLGGFGRLGSMISYNSSCAFHLKATPDPCDLSRTGRRYEPTMEHHKPILPLPLFLPSLDEKESANSPVTPDFSQNFTNKKETTPFTKINVEPGFNFSRLSYNLDDTIYSDPLLYEEFDSQKLGVNLWERSTTLPVWMKRYFKWHKKQRHHNLNPENWRSLRLLVMECLRHQPKCGGTSDRLKPLPSLIRMAASSKRLLLIHWTRPSRLEEFLLPPKGGVDWRVPDWLRKCLERGWGCYLLTSCALTVSSDRPLTY